MHDPLLVDGAAEMPPCRFRLLHMVPSSQQKILQTSALPFERDQVVFLHRRHPGVHQLGNRALDALWGGDEFGAKQKASAAERLQMSNEKEEE